MQYCQLNLNAATVNKTVLSGMVCHTGISLVMAWHGHGQLQTMSPLSFNSIPCFAEFDYLIILKLLQ